MSGSDVFGCGIYSLTFDVRNKSKVVLSNKTSLTNVKYVLDNEKEKEAISNEISVYGYNTIRLKIRVDHAGATNSAHSGSCKISII